jgi:hypothetical protein
MRNDAGQFSGKFLNCASHFGTPPAGTSRFGIAQNWLFASPEFWMSSHQLTSGGIRAPAVMMRYLIVKMG